MNNEQPMFRIVFRFCVLSVHHRRAVHFCCMGYFNEWWQFQLTASMYTANIIRVTSHERRNTSIVFSVEEIAYCCQFCSRFVLGNVRICLLFSIWHLIPWQFLCILHTVVELLIIQDLTNSHRDSCQCFVFSLYLVFKSKVLLEFIYIYDIYVIAFVIYVKNIK